MPLGVSSSESFVLVLTYYFSQEVLENKAIWGISTKAILNK